MADLRRGEAAVVLGIAAGDAASQGLRQRLMELGFVAGERLRVMAESFPARDPMAVRIGASTFALRRSEALWVQVSRA